MMKSMMLALALVSVPAFADMTPAGAPAGADARLCLGNGAFGVCLSDGHGPGHGPGWGPGPRPVQCVAQNGRGMTFEGYGRWMQEAQNNAMANCYRYSRFCQIRWCR